MAGAKAQKIRKLNPDHSQGVKGDCDTSAKKISIFEELIQKTPVYSARCLTAVSEVSAIRLIGGNLWLFESSGNKIEIRSCHDGSLLKTVTPMSEEWGDDPINNATVSSEGFVIVATGRQLLQFNSDGDFIVCIDADTYSYDDVTCDGPTVYVIVNDNCEMHLYLRSYKYEDGKYVKKTDIAFGNLARGNMEATFSIAAFNGQVYKTSTKCGEITVLGTPNVSVTKERDVGSCEFMFNQLVQREGNYLMNLSRGLCVASFTSDDPYDTSKQIETRIEIHDISKDYNVFEPDEPFKLKLNETPSNITNCVMDGSKILYMVGTIPKYKRTSRAWGLYRCEPEQPKVPLQGISANMYW